MFHDRRDTCQTPRSWRDRPHPNGTKRIDLTDPTSGFKPPASRTNRPLPHCVTTVDCSQVLDRNVALQRQSRKYFYLLQHNHTVWLQNTHGVKKPTDSDRTIVDNEWLSARGRSSKPQKYAGQTTTARFVDPNLGIGPPEKVEITAIPGVSGAANRGRLRCGTANHLARALSSACAAKTPVGFQADGRIPQTRDSSRAA